MSDKILSDNCNRAVEHHKIDDYYTGYLSMAIIMLILSPVTVILNAVTNLCVLEKKKDEKYNRHTTVFSSNNRHYWWFSSNAFICSRKHVVFNGKWKPMLNILDEKVVGVFSESITVFTSVLIVLDWYFSIFQPFHYDPRKNQIRLAISLIISSWFICFLICLILIITWNYRPIVYFVNVTDVACFVVLSLWIQFKIFIRARRTAIEIEIAIESGHFERNDTKI